MQTLTVPKPKLDEEKTYYTKGIAYELEKYLMENGIKTIGDEKAGREKRRMANGKIRTPIWEPDPETRVMRTFIIKGGISETELRDWQEYEKKHCRYLLSTTRELKHILKRQIDFPKAQWNEKLISHVMEWVRKQHPQYRKYHGLPIPPYFIYDVEFDGMEFEHALDWKIYYSNGVDLTGFLRSEGKNERWKD